MSMCFEIVIQLRTVRLKIKKMSSYSVYQFTETLETCVLPTEWVHEGQVIMIFCY